LFLLHPPMVCAAFGGTRPAAFGCQQPFGLPTHCTHCTQTADLLNERQQQHAVLHDSEAGIREQVNEVNGGRSPTQGAQRPLFPAAADITRNMFRQRHLPSRYYGSPLHTVTFLYYVTYLAGSQGSLL